MGSEMCIRDSQDSAQDPFPVGVGARETVVVYGIFSTGEGQVRFFDMPDAENDERIWSFIMVFRIYLLSLNTHFETIN